MEEVKAASSQPCYSDNFTALYSSYLLDKYLCLITFDVNGLPGNRSIVQKKPKRIFTVAVITLLLLMLWQNDVSVEYAKSNSVTWYLHMYLVHFDTLIALILIYCTTAYSQILTQIWKDWLTFGNGNLQNNADNLWIKNSSIIWMFINIIIMLMLFVYYYVRDPDLCYQWGHWIYIVSSLYKISLSVTFHAWTLSMAFTCKELTKYIHKFMTNYKHCNKSVFCSGKVDDKKVTIEEFSEMYQEIGRIAHTFNKIYSLPVLVSIAYDLIQVIIGISGYLINVMLGRPINTVFSIFVPICTLIFTINGIAFIWNCSFLKHHANSIKKELLKLTAASNDASFKKEINAFALQLLHDDINITAGGFFTIDLSLIFTMVGAGATYLVILIQFDLTFA